MSATLWVRHYNGPLISNFPGKPSNYNNQVIIFNFPEKKNLRVLKNVLRIFKIELINKSKSL